MQDNFCTTGEAHSVDLEIAKSASRHVVASIYHLQKNVIGRPSVPASFCLYFL